MKKNVIMKKTKISECRKHRLQKSEYNVINNNERKNI